MLKPTALVWLALCLIWGSTWAAIRLGLDEALPPLSFAGLRFLLAIVVLLPFQLWQRTAPPRTAVERRLVLETGLLTFALNYGLVFWAEQHVSSGLAALVYATYPLFGMLLAHFRLHAEPLTRRGVTGALLGIGGVGLLFSEQIGAPDRLGVLGVLAVLLASFGAAWADVSVKKRGVHLDPVSMTTAQLAEGTAVLLAAAVALEGNPFALRPKPKALAALVYLALVGTALGFVLLRWLMQRMAVTRTMLLNLVTPAVAVALGAGLLAERVSGTQIGGGAVIIAGLLLALRR